MFAKTGSGAGDTPLVRVPHEYTGVFSSGGGKGGTALCGRQKQGFDCSNRYVAYR